jgi:hypothetical protein
VKIKKDLGDVTPHFDRADMSMPNITLVIKFNSHFLPSPFEAIKLKIVE